MTTTEGLDLRERLLLRLEVEEFLYEEAALLDEWRLDEWLELFTDDAHYVIPSTNLPEGDPRSHLTLVDDDHLRLEWRIKRLNSRRAHREFPWSRTRRQVTNVRVIEASDEQVKAEAGVVVHRFRYGHDDSFIGLGKYTLVRTDEGFRIRDRRMELDLERLSPNGAVSMIF